MARDVNEHKKGFSKNISSKKKPKENVGLQLSEVDAMVIKNTEKIELLNICFASVFTNKPSATETQILEAREKVYRKEGLPQSRKIKLEII